MKKIIVSILIMAIWIAFVNCNKTKQMNNRIFGQHTLVKYTVNGIDSLSIYKDSLATDFEFHYNEDDNINGMKISGYTNSGSSVFILGGWSFGGNDFEIELGGGKYIGTGPFGSNKESTWNIITLKKDIWQMKTNYNGKEYFIELDKK